MRTILNIAEELTARDVSNKWQHIPIRYSFVLYTRKYSVDLLCYMRAYTFQTDINTERIEDIRTQMNAKIIIIICILDTHFIYLLPQRKWKIAKQLKNIKRNINEKHFHSHRQNMLDEKKRIPTTATGCDGNAMINENRKWISKSGTEWHVLSQNIM